MKDRICVPSLLQLYNELEERFNQFLFNVKTSMYSSKRVARKVIVTRLLLTACVKPSELKQSFIDPYKATIQLARRRSTLELNDGMLLLYIRNWYLPKPNNYLYENIQDTNLHRVTRREVQRIIQEVLNVTPKTVRLACVANLACNYNVQYAAMYYGTPGWYLRKVLRKFLYSGNEELKYINNGTI